MIKKNKYIFLLLVFCFCVLNSIAQKNNKNANQSSLKDTSKVIELNTLAWDIRLNNPDTAIIISNTALQLAQNIVVDGSKGWKKGMATIYNTLGACYDLKGNYPDALKNYFAALKIREQANDKSGLTKTLGNIGNIYSQQLDYTKALDYYIRALKIAEEIGDKKRASLWQGNIGIVYMNKREFTAALDYFFKALKIKEETSDQYSVEFTLGNIGIVYLELADYQKALEYYLKANQLAIQLNDLNGIARHTGNIGALYLRTGKLTEAEKYLKKAVILSDSIGAISLLQDDYKYLSQLYDLQGKYKLAFLNYKKYTDVKDSINSEENQKQQVRNEMNYDFEKKEAAVKAEQDKKDVIAKAELKRKEQQRNYFILGFALVGLLALFILRGYKQKQKANIIITQQKTEVDKAYKEISAQHVEIVHQKNLIQEHQKEIIDSITYAKRLQQAILPPIDLIKKKLPNSFVYYKPKDIVAGDFYWMEEINDTILIAAADCTGHGVPGAMVSVVCSNALNRAVKEFNLHKTGEILDKVTDLVVETFEKSTDEVKDGMDISLLSYNKTTKQIHWSGANNPLWYFDETELKEITADKQPIGKSDNRKPFTTHSIDYKPDLKFYLFTDGYADQFGGPKGKKFKYKQFQETLFAVLDKGPTEQQTTLDIAFEEWRGELEQVDDVCVIGIKF